MAVRTEEAARTRRTSGPATSRLVGNAADVVSALRPRHWVKNVLVLGAPLAAGSIIEPEVLGVSLLTFLAFGCAASSIYLVNDVRDRAVDVAHPWKRHRPIASGRLAVRPALVLAATLAAAALGIAAAINASLTAVVAAYLVVQFAYCLVFRSVPIVDIMIVASGFLLRAIAGGAATGIVLTRWFVAVVGFAALFAVAGKRYSEVVAEDRDRAVKRSLASVYTASYLRIVWSTAMALAIATYCLWAFERGAASGEGLGWLAASVLPFASGALRYAQLIDAGSAEAPERVLLSDRLILACGVAWMLIFVLGNVLS